MEDREHIKELGERIIILRKFRASLELVGFGMTLFGATVNAVGRGPFWLSLALGVMTSMFAWRFTSSLIDMIVTWVIAAQKGTLMALMLQKGGLDKWDCGDPSCGGCKKAREEREKNNVQV